MKRSLVLVVAMGLVMGFASQAQATNLDLTTLNSSGSLTGVPGGVAIFQQGSDNAGTGIFPSFVQVTGSGGLSVNEGYNTTVNGVLNNGSADTHNHEITLSQLTTVNIGGTIYYQFFLDVNENNNSTDRYVSLDDLIVLTSTEANQSDTNPYDLGTVRWDMQAADRVLLDFNLEPGSGYADMTFNVPVSLFSGLPGSTFVYLYSKFGAFGVQGARDYGTSDGFEEWAFFLGETTTVPDGGTTLGLLGMALLGLGYARRLVR